MKPLSEHLFWTEDTCSIYRVSRNGRVLLIDCGTRFLPGPQTGPVDRVLLTHFHRDQCSSAAAWQKAGAALVVPFAEKRFFEEADLLRASYDIFDNYTSYYPAFGPLEDLRPDAYARDYETFCWQDLRIEVVPLPGHTFGSAGYRFEVDGHQVLACGDLLCAPDRLIDYYSAQWKYMDFQGHSNLLDSLKRVASLALDWILPGHGAPFRASPGALTGLRQTLERLYEMFHARPYEYFRPRFRELAPHVFEVTNSGANTYIVRDDEGHGLFIDCGYIATAPIAANPHRFIDHLTPYLKSDLGIEDVEWFLPTHYHDDHLAGYPALRARYGTKVVSSPELKDILEHPERYEMPCAVPEGFRVDRVVGRHEDFEWRGYRFRVEQFPGQTLYHHLIRFEADGKVFLAIGDNISGLSFREQRDFIFSFIPKNRTPVESYRDMPRQIFDRSPDILLTGHGGAVDFDRAKVERWAVWMDEWQGRFERVIGQTAPSMGMDRQWVEFSPYKIRVQPGQRVRFRVSVTNHERTESRCRLVFRSLTRVELEPREAEMTVGGGQVAHCEIDVRFPAVFETHSLPVLADVTWNGRHLGEIAEALAYW